MAKCYIANEDIAGIVRRIRAEENAAWDAGLKLSRKYNASDEVLYTARNPEAHLSIIGFQFSRVPDTRIFQKIPGTPDGWRPREHKKLRKQLAALRTTGYSSLYSALRMQPIDKKFNFRMPGIREVDGVIYIQVPDDTNVEQLELVSASKMTEVFGEDVVS